MRSFFAALDTLDADSVAAFFAPDALVRLPGSAPISGRLAIRKALVWLSLAVDELRHQPVKLWTSGRLSVFDADVTLALADHTALAFPVTHVIRWTGDLIEEARVDVYLESRLALALSAFDRLR